MLNVSNVSLQYGSRVLFKEVNLSFKRGNCYGVIGANGIPARSARTRANESPSSSRTTSPTNRTPFSKP